MAAAVFLVGSYVGTGGCIVRGPRGVVLCDVQRVDVTTGGRRSPGLRASPSARQSLFPDF